MILRYRHRRIEPRLQVTRTENFVGRAVFDIFERTDRQTDTFIATPDTLRGDEVMTYNRTSHVVEESLISATILLKFTCRPAV